MTRHTLHVPPFAEYCVDGIITNPDGSLSATGATQGACSATPPPTSGFSPNAVDRMTLNYSTYVQADSRVTNVPVRVLDNVVGRINSHQTVRGYPFVNGSTVQIPGIAPGKLWQSMWTVPNGMPVGQTHAFKGVNYGAGPPPTNRLTSTNLPIDVTVYEVIASGLFVPIDRVGAHKSGLHMDGTTLITFANGDDQNQYRVPQIAGHTYVLEVKWHNAADHGDFMFTWN